MKFNKLGALAVATFVSAVPTFAQQTSVQISQDGRPSRIFRPVSGLNNEDISFMKNAAIANFFEIRSSELARQKSQDPFVLEFAKEMIADHTASRDELRDVADHKGISLPQDLPTPLKHALEHLEGLTGASFDAAYERAQKYGHADASRLYKGEIENGRDEGVKGYAVKTLPVVTMHYKMMLTKTTEMGPTQMKGGG